MAPDYLYVHCDIKEEFLNALVNAIEELYSSNVFNSGTFTKIVSERHFKRLLGFLSNGEVYYGGKKDLKSLTIEPTILDRISWNDSVMQDEIFGPILPVLKYDTAEKMVEK